MTLYRIAPPDNSALLSLSAAKQHLRVDNDDSEFDAVIAGMIAAAIETLDGRDGWLRRALASQIWETRLAAFPAEIELPLPPLIELQSVKYYDPMGTLQTLATTEYETVGAGGFGKGRVLLKTGKSWPATDARAEAVIVRFRAGYIDTIASPPMGALPAPILMAIKKHVAHLFDNREIQLGREESRNSQPFGYDALLAPYRVW